MPRIAHYALGALLGSHTAHGHPAAKHAPSTQPASAQAHQSARESVTHRAYRLAHQDPLDVHILRAARSHGIDPFVLRALLWAESRLVADRVNRKSGASGIAQLTRSGRQAVARLLGSAFTLADALDPALAIPAAALLLAHGRETCGDMLGAIRAYNSGSCRRSQAWASHVIRHANRLRTLTGLPPLPPPRQHVTARNS